jgi:hypothetical protein
MSSRTSNPRRHWPRPTSSILHWRAPGPDRHEEKLAHHTGGIAEQRRKFRKRMRIDFARGHTGGRELLHGQSISFRSGRAALKHARLTITR